MKIEMNYRQDQQDARKSQYYKYNQPVIETPHIIKSANNMS